MLDIPFFPIGATGATPNSNVNIAATSSVQVVNLPAATTQQSSLRVVVKGTSSIAFAYGNCPNLNMSNGVVMLAPTVEVFTIPAGVSQISVIADAAGSTVFFYVGDGL